MKRLYAVATILGIAGVAAAAAALALDKTLPYRIGFNAYSKYLWVGRLATASVGLGLLTLLSGIAARKGWLPVVLGLLSLSPLVLVGGVHSGPNPEAWCFNNLRQIEGAKAQLAHEGGLTNGTPVTMPHLARFFPAGVEFRCAERGTYRLNSIGNEARCTFHGTITEMEANWQRQMRDQRLDATQWTQPIHSKTIETINAKISVD